jgi:MFS family permease
VAGLLGSWLLIKDTKLHAQTEGTTSTIPKLQHVFTETTWKNNNLSSITQAGLINNLNDGMVWGLLPMLLIARSFSLEQTGLIVAAYPVIWGVGQLGTGKLADIWPARPLLFAGMLLQALVLAGMAIATTYSVFIVLSVLLGLGTALVYPTFLAVMARYTHPDQRPESIGVFRLWRDLGYAFGALLSGVIADTFGIEAAIYTIAILTLFSAFIIRLRMDK